MRHARLTAHGELVDHLSQGRVGPFVVEFELPVGLRDLVQSCGIPHVEVGRLCVDGAQAGWDRRIDGGNTVEIWACHPRSDPEPDPRLLLDVHLGKLARLLRLLGFDTCYAATADDEALAGAAIDQDRVLLTRDRGLLMRSAIRRGRWIRETDPERQASEILDAFHLADGVAPFTRCLSCNGTLAPTDPSPGEVPPGVFRLQSEYRRCSDCGQVFWPGSHHPGLERTIERIVRAAARS